jgi:hypothetical protein
VEWSPVIAGAVLASAISFVLLTFGAAIGLSATSPWPHAAVSPQVVATLAVLWALVQQIGAFMVGGYIAGRMRTRWSEAAQHEVEFRDGLHGGLVWALGVVIGAALLLAGAGAAARTGIDLAKTAAATSTSNPFETVIDAMMRPTSVAQAAPAASSPPAATAPATGARPQAQAAQPVGEETRAEIARVLAGAVASGSLSEQNRTYLVQLVSQRSGVPQQEAEKRVNEAINAAREAVDKARRAAILTGLITAVGLVVSFAAAWWAAQKGGQHRDNSVPPRFGFGVRRSGPAMRD